MTNYIPMKRGLKKKPQIIVTKRGFQNTATPQTQPATERAQVKKRIITKK